MKLKDIPEILQFLPENIRLDVDIPENINLDADINDKTFPIDGKRKAPLLHWACENHKIDLIEMLLIGREKYGLDVNALDSDYSPALSYTSDFLVIKMLIEAGVDVTISLYPPKMMPHILCVLFIDRILPRSYSGAQGELCSSNLSPQCADVLAVLYDRYFCDAENSTQLAITLTAATGIGKEILPLIAEYAFCISSITKHKKMHNVARLRTMCKRAYEASKKDQFLDVLYKAVGSTGLEDLVTLFKQNGIAKLSMLLNQPIPSACAAQNIHPAVLSFSSSRTETQAAIKPKLKEHPCKMRKPGT